MANTALNRYRTTISSSVVAITAIATSAELLSARKAEIQCLTASIAFCWDASATTLTAANGHVLQANEFHLIEGNHNINQLKFIRATGSDGAVQITIED